MSISSELLSVLSMLTVSDCHFQRCCHSFQHFWMLHLLFFVQQYVQILPVRILLHQLHDYFCHVVATGIIFWRIQNKVFVSNFINKITCVTFGKIFSLSIPSSGGSLWPFHNWLILIVWICIFQNWNLQQNHENSRGCPFLHYQTPMIQHFKNSSIIGVFSLVLLIR